MFATSNPYSSSHNGPLTIANSEHSTSLPNTALPLPHLSQMEILLIDHEEALRDFLGQTLEAHGGNVTCAPDGRVAMQLYRRQTYDLVVTELLMPERDGLEVIMDLRKYAPQTPIIAMSNGGSAAWRDVLGVAQKLGARRTLLKPFTTRDLLAAITDIIDTPQPGRH